MKECKPEDIALKSFFLGPQAENATFIKQEVLQVLDLWVDWRRQAFPKDGEAIPLHEQQSPAFQERLKLFHQEVEHISKRLFKEIPKFSPRYIGHMFSDISLPALLGHFVTLLHNPNNVSLESSKVGVDLEKEAIADLAKMFNLPPSTIGHFTSGGTVANLESVVRAKNRWLHFLASNWQSDMSFNDASYLEGVESDFSLKNYSDIKTALLIRQKFQIDFGGPVLLVPDHKHYSWAKAASYFGLGKDNLVLVKTNDQGRMDTEHLKYCIEKCLSENKIILSIVSVFGSTELAAIDPIYEIQNIIDQYKKSYGYHFWHHVDAAYGGFFASLRDINDKEISEDFKKSIHALADATSITVDPHKLGYVPYASGAFLCRYPKDYFISEHTAPYVDFQSHSDKGPYTIEGSRSAGGAIATKLAATCIGFDDKGYGSILLRTIKTCSRLKASLEESNIPILILPYETTNICCFAVGTKNIHLSQVNRLTEDLLLSIQQDALKETPDVFYVSQTLLSKNYERLIEKFCKLHQLQQDSDSLKLVRLTIMNPFFHSKHSKTNYTEAFINYLQEKVQTAPFNCS